jgi:hypothetical protein
MYMHHVCIGCSEQQMTLRKDDQYKLRAYYFSVRYRSCVWEGRNEIFLHSTNDFVIEYISCYHRWNLFTQ